MEWIFQASSILFVFSTKHVPYKTVCSVHNGTSGNVCILKGSCFRGTKSFTPGISDAVWKEGVAEELDYM